MQKEQNVRLVLASASPRRRELLLQIGLKFSVMPSTKEENANTTEAGALVQELSRQKAADIWEQLSGGQGQNPDTDQEQISEETQEPNLNGKRQPELLVIGADTVVCCEGKILGKPHDREAAVEMLTALQGRSLHRCNALPSKGDGHIFRVHAGGILSDDGSGNFRIH